MTNYDQYIHSINSHPYNFINIFCAKSNKKISLKNLNNNNYLEFIIYFLKEYFNFKQNEDIKMLTSNGMKYINNLKFNDLNDSKGTIIYITL
jgi:hypothetical protein